MSEDDKHQAAIDRLTAERDHARAELRRVYDELDWRDEKIRVLERAVVRLARREESSEPA